MGACIMVQSKQFWKIQCERCKSNHEFTVIGLHITFLPPQDDGGGSGSAESDLCHLLETTHLH